MNDPDSSRKLGDMHGLATSISDRTAYQGQS